MAFFSKFMGFRLRDEELDALEELLEKYPLKYSDKSHVVRCAIINLLDDERRHEEYEIKRNKK